MRLVSSVLYENKLLRILNKLTKAWKHNYLKVRHLHLYGYLNYTSKNRKYFPEEQFYVTSQLKSEQNKKPQKDDIQR